MLKSCRWNPCDAEGVEFFAVEIKFFAMLREIVRLELPVIVVVRPHLWNFMAFIDQFSISSLYMKKINHFSLPTTTQHTAAGWSESDLDSNLADCSTELFTHNKRSKFSIFIVTLRWRQLESFIDSEKNFTQFSMIDIFSARHRGSICRGKMCVSLLFNKVIAMTLTLFLLFSSTLRHCFRKMLQKLVYEQLANSTNAIIFSPSTKLLIGEAN